MLSISYRFAYDRARTAIEDSFVKDVPTSYKDILARTLRAVTDELNADDDFDGATFNHGNIRTASCGDYQGSLFFLITSNSYDCEAWTTRVSYGSCSHCDAYEAARDLWEDSEDADCRDVSGFVSLSLHLWQSMKSV
ncbi:MAG: hypothetical protein GY906_04940 [bacterium]|nr:hypothetical protein [bacterium]